MRPPCAAPAAPKPLRSMEPHLEPLATRGAANPRAPWLLNSNLRTGSRSPRAAWKYGGWPGVFCRISGGWRCRSAVSSTVQPRATSSSRRASARAKSLSRRGLVALGRHQPGRLLVDLGVGSPGATARARRRARRPCAARRAPSSSFPASAAEWAAVTSSKMPASAPGVSRSSSMWAPERRRARPGRCPRQAACPRPRTRRASRARRSPTPKRRANPSSLPSAFSASASVSGVTSMGER